MRSESRTEMHKLRPQVVVGDLGRDKEGVFHVEAAFRAGISKDQLSRLAASGVIRRPRPRVCVLSAFPHTWQQDAAVAQTWAAPDGVLSHNTAAALWGLRNFGEPRPIELTSAAYLRSRSPDVVVHRRRRWLPGDVCHLGRLMLTSPARTIIDIAGQIPVDRLRDALDEVLVRELVTLDRMQRRLKDAGRQGRPGAAALQRLIREFESSDLPPRSVLERRYLKCSRQARLPEPRLQHPVVIDGESYRIDFAYPTAALAVELDGWRFHGGREAWEADIKRSNALVAGGWQVIRGTWRDVKNDPRPLIDRVAELLSPRMLPLRS